MAESQIAGENSFIRGLISEATGLNFPKDACTDTLNCVFDAKGTVSRRLGIDYETSASTANTVTRDSSAVSEFVWESVAGDGNRSFLVLQVGDTLHFWNIPSSGALSANKKSFTVSLSTYAVSGATNIETRACQFATGQGDLFVAHPNCEPFYVSYSSSGDTITTKKIVVFIRDLVGIEENIPFNVRPTSMTTAHKYNLWNQGWYVGYTNVKKLDGTNPSPASEVPFEWWSASSNRGDKRVDGYPSNADVWWQYKDAYDVFSMQVVANAGKTPPSTPAPKGHFLMKAFQQYKGYCKVYRIDQSSGSSTATVTLYEGVPFYSGNSIVIENSGLAKFDGARTVTSVGSGTSYDTFTFTASDTTGTDATESEEFYCYLANSAAEHITAGTNRPNCIAFFAGRVWYGGINADKFNDKIYFSKIIEQKSDYGRCYQVNDPTAEDLSDLLPSDGGVISIPEIGNIVKMIPVGNDLVLFATNGIWRISGSEGIGFRANDYSVTKVSSVTSVSATSFVVVEGSPVFWNNDGIYILSSEGVQSISDKTIKTWFAALPTNAKSNAKGTYNPLKKTVYWLYRSTASTTTDNAYEYDRVLCFNTITGAFYPWSVSQSSGYPTVNGISVTQYLGAVGSTTKFITTVNTTGTTYTITFSEEKDTSYVDWETPGTGIDYSSYFYTGFKLPGDGLRQQFGNYINVFCTAATDSSVKLRARWDYSNSSASGEWSTEQEVYVARTYRDTLKRRIKLRGRGIACQLAFRSTSGKPFNVIGWSMLETVNQST